jgi:outer membrane biosynthesis protein TonB
MEKMKELIIQSLETKGVLGQIRAHLRSAVFKVVDEQDQQFNTGCGLKWENKTLYKILETKIGTLLAEIIREFMEYFRMDYSLSIFIPECGISPERLNRKEILGKLGIMNNPSNDKFTAGLHLPLLYYIINYFISELKENPNKVIDSIKKYQSDIEAKSDELIENNMTEYFKNQKMEEENIPLSNNSRETNPPKKEEKKEEIKDEVLKEEKKEEIKNEIKEEKKEAKKEEKKEEIPKEKKEEKKQEKKNGGNDVQNYDDIVEDIPDIEDIEELSANKNSGNYNSSQTISQSQGGDNTVDSHVLENYNYVEQNEKK